MLTLKSLSFIAGGRFVERQTIDFTRLGSIAQVAASNDNTGDSSGSGKSTIFKLLDFLLGLNQIPTGVLQSRLTEDALDVEGLFDMDGLPVRIQRGRKYLIDINGEITTGNAKKTDEVLAKVLGMDDKLFRKILHKRQKEGGFFLKMTASQIHKFLTTCLGMEAETQKIVVIDKDIERLSKLVAEYEILAASARSSLETTKNFMQPAEPKCSVDKEIVDRLFLKYKENESKLNALKDFSKSTFEALEKERPTPKQTPFDRTLIIETGTQMEQIRSWEKEQKEVLEKERPTVKVTTFDRTEIDSIELEQIRLRDQIAQLQNEENLRQKAAENKIFQNTRLIEIAEQNIQVGNKAKIRAQSLAAQIEKIRASLCPMCEQSWVTENIKNQEAKLLEEIRACKAEVIAGMKSESDLPTLKAETVSLRGDSVPRAVDVSVQRSSLQTNQSKIDLLKKAEQDLMRKDAEDTQAALTAFNLKRQEISSRTVFKLSELERQLNDLKALEFAQMTKDREETQRLTAEFNTKERSVRDREALILSEAQSKLDETKSQWSSAQSELSYYEKSLMEYHKNIESYRRELQKCKNNVFVSTSQLETDKDKLEIALESKKEIKSYLSASFEDALESIGDMATTLIRGIPNMATATIQFDGLRETQDGKIKEEINAVIHMDGELDIPLNSLSGGEETSAELAIDLAVIHFIEERTGKGINLMILDEPFNGLDFTCSSNTLEMLKNSNLGKTILIVDHNPVLKEQIDSKITVVRSGLTSRIVQ